jgi:hypothetical protein
VASGFPPASRAQLWEKIPFMTPMSIHRNIGIEKDVDPLKHRDRNGLVQSKVIVIQSRAPGRPI